MGSVKMHADEVDTDTALVRRLLADQFPQWGGLPIRPVVSYGTDHDIDRVGEHLAVRMPRIGWATAQAKLEARWLPRLAPHLPLAVPVQLAMGRPASGYPFDWSVYEWLPGASLGTTTLDTDAGPVEALHRAAVDLAGFIRALRGIDTAGADPRPAGARGGPLADKDAGVRGAIRALGDRIDGAAALRSWEESLAAPAHDGPGRWLHGDLLPGNLLAVDGRLSAVIDFGCLTVGDPACDLLPAWNLFTGPSCATSRATFREAVEAGDAEWLRGRGWALAQAVIALPYYWDTNPAMVRQALRAVTEVTRKPVR